MVFWISYLYAFLKPFCKFLVPSDHHPYRCIRGIAQSKWISTKRKEISNFLRIPIFAINNMPNDRNHAVLGVTAFIMDDRVGSTSGVMTATWTLFKKTRSIHYRWSSWQLFKRIIRAWMVELGDWWDGVMGKMRVRLEQQIEIICFEFTRIHNLRIHF